MPERCIAEEGSLGAIAESPRLGESSPGTESWPVKLERGPEDWFPAQQRMIGLIRSNQDSFVLPPAVVRKSAWRE